MEDLVFTLYFMVAAALAVGLIEIVCRLWRKVRTGKPERQ
jgi:hypothetical protein